VQPRGLPPRATYTFKHVLIRDAAYDSLLHSDRRRHHLALAQTLEGGLESGESEPELIAHHYAEAGQATAAIDLWQRAAERAVARSANAEAVAHLRRGLDLAAQISDPTARAERELGLLSSLAMPLALRQGYAAPEVEAVFLRARDLAMELGSSPSHFGVVRGMLGLYEVSGRYDRAAECATELARLADESGDAAWAVEAEWEQGSVALFTGRLADARRHLERALSLYDPVAHRMNAYVFGEDPGMMAHVHASLACWLAGDADAAVEHIEAGIRLGEEVRHPNSIGMALCFGAALHQQRGDVDRTIAHAEAALRLATDHEFPLWIGLATVYLGWAAAQTDRLDDGIERMRAGIASWRATGAEEAVPGLLALVADAQLRAGRVDDAAATVADAQAIAERNGERFYEPELHRLSAEVLHAAGGADDDVERRFRRGLDVAHACGARALELRAALGLGRLWAATDRADEARALVREALPAARNGADTRDVRDACAFLAEAR
jgi:predicted ATPase